MGKFLRQELEAWLLQVRNLADLQLICTMTALKYANGADFCHV